MDSATRHIVLVIIVVCVAVFFGLLGAICCFFKSKCIPLYEANQEPAEQLLILRHKQNLSKESLINGDCESEASFRKTLFQIFIGSTNKPSRAVCHTQVESQPSKFSRWSRKLSLVRKSTSGKTIRSKASALTNLPEEEELDFLTAFNASSLSGSLPTPDSIQTKELPQ